MRIAHAAPVALLVFVTSCAKKHSHRPPAYWAPPQQQQPMSPQYAFPWAAPAGSGTAAVAPTAATPADTSINADFDKCLAESATTDDCKAAIESARKTPGVPGVYPLYQRACEKKVKQLLGCGAFKSTAISEGDHPTMELLMRCELGAAARCEEVKTKVAPLQAWLSTLKTTLCKQGENALCADYHQCKKPAKWTCEDVAGGTKACGCLAPCEGTRTITATQATWPDGSARAAAVCTETATH